MTVFTPQSLALRGVSVVRDGQNVGLRLGAESQTASPTPEVRINPRHPSPSRQRGFMAAWRPDDHAEYDRVAADAAPGAGRSLSRDGVPSRRSTARIGCSAIPFGWPKPQGAPQSRTAKRLPTSASAKAVENAASLARPLPPHASRCAAVKPNRLTPAGRTPSASTWAS